MTNDINDVSVIYITYVPYGTLPLNEFIQSYKKYPASHQHSLVIVFKGMSDKSEVTEFTEILEKENILYHALNYFEQGLDVSTYFWAAKSLSNEYIFFLNSRSVIRNVNWLAHFINNMNPAVGMISATGSFQSYYSSVFQKHKAGWESQKGFVYNFRKYKLFLKAFFYWRFLFKSFPNPHLRTNGFIVRRGEFLKMYPGPLITKFSAYLFENGKNSLSNKYIKDGKETLVVDKHGKTFNQNEWKGSNTFWINEQENLLIADNQTAHYEAASPEERKAMTKLAWG